jgi:hypothetical protein
VLPGQPRLALGASHRYRGRLRLVEGAAAVAE